MRPNLCPSTPSRVSASGRLGAAVRHSPYAPRHAPTSKSGASKPVSKKPSLTRSVGASLRPTFSMLEEYEVDDLLGPGVSEEDSVPSLSYASFSSQSEDSLDHCPSPTGSVDHLRGYIQSQASNRALYRDWSIATTVLEIPGGPARQHPSYGVLGDFSGSSSESSIDEDKAPGIMNWVATTPSKKTVPRFASMRPYGDESETDSDNISMEEIVVRLPLPAPLDTRDTNDTLSSSSSSSSPISDGLSTPCESPVRRRIWEVRADDYVPRPAGAPPQSMPSVLEIGMQWERAHQAESPRSKDEKRTVGAVGHIRRIYGDAQYMN